ncbi:MAG: hypothetical protein EB082_20470, partial [Verrucomicrobia bacterium]|nr:hypothetical protein [Verrucomicrobiota bacterium]
MVRHIRDVFLPADVHDALARVHVPQDADFLFCAVAFSFHDLGPFCWTQTEPSSGSNFRDHVTRVVIEDFRIKYNHKRPHSKLGYQTPARFAANL